MEKISYSVDLISLQCLCFYSPCHSQLKNFLFHGNKQKVHNSQGSKAGSLQFGRISPLQWDRRREKYDGATMKTFAI